MKDQADGLRELAARSRSTASGAQLAAGGRVLAVTSGKGGVGKTNVVANLGAVLAGRGHTVTVIDADLGLANLDILLNLNPPKNLGHLVRGEAEAAEVVVEVSERFQLIPGASGIEALVDLDGLQRERLLGSLAGLIEGREFVLIDTAAGIGRNVVEPCLAAGEVVLITNPEPTSLTDAYGLAKVVWSRDPTVRVGVVVNSVAGPEQARGVHEKLDRVTRRFLGGTLAYLGHIVRDTCVSQATQRQIPFVVAYPRSRASRCVEELADAVLGTDPSQARGTWAFWHRLLHFSAR